MNNLPRTSFVSRKYALPGKHNIIFQSFDITKKTPKNNKNKKKIDKAANRDEFFECRDETVEAGDEAVKRKTTAL